MVTHVLLLPWSCVQIPPFFIFKAELLLISICWCFCKSWLNHTSLLWQWLQTRFTALTMNLPRQLSAAVSSLDVPHWTRFSIPSKLENSFSEVSQNGLLYRIVWFELELELSVFYLLSVYISLSQIVMSRIPGGLWTVWTLVNSLNFFPQESFKVSFKVSPTVWMLYNLH